MEIVQVQTSAHWRDFHRLPFRIYGDDPHWVPPLLLERRLHFTPKHNSYFDHARASFWLAYRDGEAVGRISAQIDQLHLERYQDGTGQFGFIEAIDDADVFSQLLRTAEDWLRASGLSRACGPISFSMWDESGLLVEGFDTPPYVMMGHARPYYEGHIKAAGYRGIQDLLAYSYVPQLPMPPIAHRILERAERSGDLRVRNIRMGKAHLDDEIAVILDLLNDAWSDNWGFVPMTPREMADLAGILKRLLRPGDVAFAEYRDEVVAFSIIFPNLNEAIRDLGGRLAPFGWLKLLWRLKVQHTRTMRMALMGVRKSLQSSAIGAALALSVIQAMRQTGIERGVEHAELSWVLDSNKQVKRIIKLVGAEPYKRYRIYEKTL